MKLINVLLALAVVRSGSTTTVTDVKTAATAQGIATFPLANGISSLSTTVTATFTNPATTLTDTCGAGSSYPLSAKTFSMDPTSTTDVTTDDTRTQPTVTWACTAGKQYTMVMFDAGPYDGTRLTASTGQGQEFHWIKINIPCASSGTASAAEGTQYGSISFMSPGNPSTTEAHNYGFYVFEQAGAINPTSTEEATILSQRQNVQADFPAFLSTYAAQIPNGPIARTWAYVKWGYSSTVKPPIAPTIAAMSQNAACLVLESAGDNGLSGGDIGAIVMGIVLGIVLIVAIVVCAQNKAAAPDTTASDETADVVAGHV